MYLITLGPATARKNKLEEAFYEYLQSIERQLLDNFVVKPFARDIVRKYNDEFCPKFPRCKPVEKRMWTTNTHDKFDDIIIYCGYVTVRFLWAKNRFWMDKIENRQCRVCGCTDDDCSQCIEKTGDPCHWVLPDLCSACAIWPWDESP